MVHCGSGQISLQNIECSEIQPSRVDGVLTKAGGRLSGRF